MGVSAPGDCGYSVRPGPAQGAVSAVYAVGEHPGTTVIEAGEPIAVQRKATAREKAGFKVLEAVQREVQEGMERLKGSAAERERRGLSQLPLQEWGRLEDLRKTG